MTSLRHDTALERALLAQAELEVGFSGFAEHAIARLDAGEEVYGDRWTRQGLRRLLDEVREESADLGSWSVLAPQALENEPGLDDDSRKIIRIALGATIRFGALTHCALDVARGHVSQGSFRLQRPAMGSRSATHGPRETRITKVVIARDNRWRVKRLELQRREASCRPISGSQAPRRFRALRISRVERGTL